MLEGKLGQSGRWNFLPVPLSRFLENIDKKAIVSVYFEFLQTHNCEYIVIEAPAVYFLLILRFR